MIENSIWEDVQTYDRGDDTSLWVRALRNSRIYSAVSNGEYVPINLWPPYAVYPYETSMRKYRKGGLTYMIKFV